MFEKTRNKLLIFHLYFIKPIDWWLLGFLALILATGITTLYSATNQSFYQINLTLGYIAAGSVVVLILANLEQRFLIYISLPVYILGVFLLVAVALSGQVVNGSRRWLDLGLVFIQPSEILKIAVPLLLASMFDFFRDRIRFYHFLLAIVIIAIPAVLVFRQPDLGTAILITLAGVFVIFFAGLSWRIIFLGLVLLGSSLPLIWKYALHDYQKSRIETLFDPASDPLGSGYHINQSIIAIGSGGLNGKGWLNGTQTQLDFVPEKHTDFIFAVYSEEFGFIGALVLFFLYFIVIARLLYISFTSETTFGRLTVSSFALSLFIYVFVNVGMVIGILPVVGVPLPFMSYGGTAMISMLTIFGIVMCVRNNRDKTRFSS